MGCEQVEALGYGLDQSINDLETARFEKDVEGEVLEIRFRLRREAMDLDPRDYDARATAIRTSTAVDLLTT